jgi:hypothetical protein
MRGSAAFRTGIAPGSALAGPWVRNELWRRAKAVPSLDLRFAESKSLVDATTGQSLVTFTRASSGTYVGSDGRIKTATTNLLVRSEEFDNASWAKTRSSVTANSATAPNGTSTADGLVEDATATATHQTGQTSISYVSGVAYTFSVYAKTSSARRLRLQLPAAAFTSNTFAVFDLSNGSVSTSGNSPVTSVVLAGDGWYRLSISKSATTTASSVAELFMTDSSNNATYSGDGTSTILLWGAQLEQSSTVGEYIPTTSTINSAPRFDHNLTTGESLGLLVEEQRTNLLLRSEEFDNASWNSSAGARTVTANNTTAPDGASTADKVTADGTNAAHFVSQSVTLTAQPYALSVFAKKDTEEVFTIRAFTALGGALARFNLTTGIVSSFTSTGASITAYPNGWYRCTMVFTPLAATGGLGLYVGTDLPNTGTGSLFLWGAQLE